jgi:nucleoside-diphosphate-sugar epimerase
MRVLITGAAGFIGSHLTEACIERGWQVTAIDSLTTYYSPADKVRNAEAFSRHPRCLYLEQDLIDVDLSALMRDIDVVFHLAAQAGVRASWGQGFDAYTQLNVTALQRLLEASLHAKSLQKFVFASSSSVYGDAEALPTTEDQILRPISPYGATKALGEHLCYLYYRAFGLSTVALRFFSVYGPRQRPDMGFHRLIEAGLSGAVFSLYGDGEQTRDFTYVDDIIDGILSSASKATPGTVLNLGGGARISMNDAIELVRQEFPNLAVDRLETGRGDARDTAADISRARELIGYEPKTTVPEGIARQINWHLERHDQRRRAQPASTPRGTHL